MSSAIVDFVVPTWNNREIVSSTLQSIKHQTISDFTCTVVDDNSTDGTPDFIRTYFPWVRIVVKERNRGPASSRNIGYAQGTAKYVVFMDSDVSLHPSWTEEQIHFLESDPAIGCVSGKLIHGRSPELLYAAYGTMNRLGVAWDAGFGHSVSDFSRPLRCLWANTTAMMVRREVIYRIGDFDSAMFTMFEDTDLGWRMNICGYKVIFNPGAVAVHAVHGTLNPLEPRLVYLVWRNRARSVLINYEAKNLLTYGTAFLLLSLLHATLFRPRKQKLAALWWNVSQLSSTLRRRKQVQGLRSVGDNELWSMFESRLRGPGYGASPEKP